jgi:hypothetical protein
MTREELATLLTVALRHHEATGMALQTIAASLNAAPIEEQAVAPPVETPERRAAPGTCPRCLADAGHTRVTVGDQRVCLSCRHEWSET